MNPIQIAIFLTGFSLCAFVVSVIFVIVRRTFVMSWILLILSAMGLCASVWIGTTLAEGQFLSKLTIAFMILSRVELTAFALGVFCALPISGLLTPMSSRAVQVFTSLTVTLAVLGTIIAGTILSAKDLISPYLPHKDSVSAATTIGSATDHFEKLDYADTNILPIRVSVSPAGRVYISGHRGAAAQEGAIVELINKDDGTVEEKMVARMLNRPYGLLALEDELLVSRSGQYTRWSKGKAKQFSTGAVTLLRDLDADGVMDYYHDIVTDLPGAKGPDNLHQNNGIAVGPDGAIYITTANHTDGHPSIDPMAGAILRASGEDFEKVEVFADGLRNPFGIAFDSAARLIATDNDPQSGALGNMGDKLLEVSKGDFFGHPYAPDENPEVREPLLRSTFSLGGLTLATSDSLPAPYKDSLFVVVYGEGRIMRIEQTSDGNTSLIPFATVPGAVDIAAAPNGDFYVAVYPDKVVKLRYKGENN